MFWLQHTPIFTATCRTSVPPGPASFLMVRGLLPDTGSVLPKADTCNTQWAKHTWWSDVAWQLQTLTVTAEKVYEKWVPADPTVSAAAHKEWDTVGLWSGQPWFLEGVTVSNNWVWERWRLCPDANIPVSLPCAATKRAATKRACRRCLSKPHRNLAVLLWHSKKRLNRSRPAP